MRAKNNEMTAEDFEALSPDQKRRIVGELERMTTQELLARSRPLTKDERIQELRMRKAAKSKIGRPTVGRGAKQLAITLERDLLKEADAYAKKRGLKRSEMIAKGLRLLMAS